MLNTWVYWEGAMPDWIGDCIKTIRAHTPQLRLVGPKEWEELWLDNRDIDLTHLCLSHKSDFIRAYLLSKYGGLYIDADCVVMRGLVPVLSKLEEVDFLAAPQQDRDVSGAFSGSKPGGVIASAWHKRQCDILRNKEPIEWLSLASQALMNAIWATGQEWWRLPTQAIHPVPWSDQRFFCRLRSDLEQHRAVYNPCAITYMMSNSMMGGCSCRSNLSNPESFFQFLIRQSGHDRPSVDLPGQLHTGNY